MSKVIPFDHSERAAEAEDVAIRVLDFIGKDEDRLKRFLRSTGMTHDQVRAAASQTSLFHLGVLDHVLRDERTVRDLAEGAEITEGDLRSAVKALSPAEEPKAAKKAKGGRDPSPELPRRSLFVPA